MIVMTGRKGNLLTTWVYMSALLLFGEVDCGCGGKESRHLPGRLISRSRKSPLRGPVESRTVTGPCDIPLWDVTTALTGCVSVKLLNGWMP
jgi:hypothetical protein